MAIAQNFPTISPSLLLDFANVQALDSRVTFTRASTATYYGTRTALAEQNLLSYSEQFNNALWLAASLITVTANSTVAPDGNTTADTAAANSNGIVNAVFRNEITPPIGSTFSVYAKANSVNFLAIAVGATSNVWASFNLSTGTLGSNGAGCTPSIVSVGNGWYRCIVANIGTASNQILLFPKTADVAGNPYSTGSVSIGDSIFLWGAQAEQRSTVTAYTVTTTQPITNYVPILETAASGVARFDHNPTTFESLGLLIEEQRTNLVLYSSDFSNAYWVKNNSTLTSNTLVSPDGTLNADKLTETTANNFHYLRASQALAVSTNYAYSLYAKASERQIIRISVYDGANTFIDAKFNLANGTVFSTTFGTASIVNVGNGFYRCICTGTSSASASTALVDIYTCDNSGAATYTGDGYSGLYIWGAQIEAGAFASSYIPTVASQVTRAADSASMTGTNFTSWYRADEGTLYTEAQSNGLLSAGPIAVEASNGTINERLVTGQFVAGAVRSLTVQNGNVSQVLLSNTVSPLGYIKSSGAYKFNDFAGTVNGGTVLTDTNGTLPIVDRLTIGSNGSTTTQILNGTIKKIAYYPLRLTNTNLQALTG